MNAVVDLNSDLGEGASHDDEILDLVTSANIACGRHAGDSVSILATIGAAKVKGVAVGAHPSFDDRENFGRREIAMSPADVYELVANQLRSFQALCVEADVEMNHVKPHGGLYNMAARDLALAEAIAQALLDLDPHLLLFVPPRSCLEAAAMKMGLDSMSEVFADRNYMPDGSLVARSRADALLHEPAAAAERVIRILQEGKVKAVDGTDIEMHANTVCVHGDTPEAVSFIRELRYRLELEDITIAAPGKRA